MFKIALTLTAVLAVTAFTAAQEGDISNFAKIFNELHRDPAPQVATKANVKTLWIEQKLDHFDANGTRTWQMVGN